MRLSFKLLALACTILGSCFTSRAQGFSEPALPSDPSFKTEEIHCISQGNDIYGVRFTPTNAGKKMPAIIMSHGYNGNPVLFYTMINALAKDGFICYFFDFAGGSSRTRSEGATTDMSLRTEQQNLTDVIDMVRSWKDVDKKNVFLVGESQGGIVTALTAAACADKIKAIGLMYPAFCIPINAKDSYPTLNSIPEKQNVMGLDLGKVYYSDIFDMNVYYEISGFRKDVLIVHGDADTLVPLVYSVNALPIYEHAELKVIPGAPHGFYMGDDPAINAKYMQEFFNAEYRKK